MDKTEEGQLAVSLLGNGLAYEQFRLDPARPDTSKFAALMGQISMHMGDTVKRRKYLGKYLDYYWAIDVHTADIIWDYQRGGIIEEGEEVIVT